jgi:ribosomal protein L11 methylase PrmA
MSGVLLRPWATDPGSFRDPHSAVVIEGGFAYRFFRGPAAADVAAARSSGLFDRLVAEGAILDYESVPEAERPAQWLDLPGDAVVLRQPKLAFISYPYEWPFGILKRAALFHLGVLKTALGAGLILKDASAYNVQFDGMRPVFIDLGSFARYEPGTPWRGYAQFCAMFLNPLLLHAAVGIPFQPWLRSSLEGIAATELERLLPLRTKLRPAIFTNVVLQSQLQRRFGGLDPDDLAIRPRVELPAMLRQVERLRGLIDGLRAPTSASTWSSYEDNTSYSVAAHAKKSAFVDRVVAELDPEVAWDLGCNRGEYALLAAKHARTVVAIDGDPNVMEMLVNRLPADARVLPLVMDLRNPSPEQGWAERERRGLRERGKADVVLALALVHHLRFGANVPLGSFAAWLAGIARAGVVEFIPRSDPMVRRLLAWREDVFEDYDQETFEAELRRHFVITAIEGLPESARRLYAFRADGDSV